MEYEYINRYVQRKKRDVELSTLNQYKDTLIRFMELMRKRIKVNTEEELYKSIDNNVLEDFYFEYEETHKKSCYNRSVSIVRSFFDYLVEDKGLIPFNPYGRIKGYKPMEVLEDTKEKEVLTREELQQFIRALDIYTYGSKGFIFTSTRDKFLFTLMASTGVRVERLLEAKLSDVILKDTYAILVIPKDKKLNKERYIPISGKCYKYFTHYLTLRKKMSGDYLFLSYRDEKLTKAGVNKNIKKTLEKAHIDKHITNHCFRHYANNQLKANGTPEYTIKYILGWSSKDMMNTYYDHYTNEFERSLVSATAKIIA